MPGNKKSEKLQLLWNGFKEIIWDLKLDFPTNGSINYLEEKIVGWFKIFSSSYWVKYVTTKLCKIVAYFNQQGIDKIMMWLPIIILDSLTTEVLLLYGNFFKRNIKFNFWKQLGMKGWNRVTTVVNVSFQVIQSRPASSNANIAITKLVAHIL